jgi:hypothetical protein
VSVCEQGILIIGTSVAAGRFGAMLGTRCNRHQGLCSRCARLRRSCAPQLAGIASISGNRLDDKQPS